ncbi:MAG: hypothetical protein ABJA94_01475 [Rhodoglobus sp.]
MFGGFTHLVTLIVGGLLSFFLFLVVVALLFLLVRFLLVGTRAAHLYIAKNSPAATTPAARPATTAAAVAKAATAPAKPAAASAKPTTKATAKPRTPKPPTA